MIFFFSRSGGSRISTVPSSVPPVVDIFAVRRLEVHDPCAGRWDDRLGHPEGGAVAVVEADRDVPHQLHVLALVVADGNALALVEQHVGRHQHRIGEQADADRLAALGLGLELGHPRHLAGRRDAGQDPGQLGVLAHVRLDEQRRAVGVDAGCEQQRGEVERGRAELLDVVRHRQRVQVDDAEQAVVPVLVGDPVPDRPEQVAEVLRPVGWMPEKTRAMSPIVLSAAGPERRQPGRAERRLAHAHALERRRDRRAQVTARRVRDERPAEQEQQHERRRRPGTPPTTRLRCGSRGRRRGGAGGGGGGMPRTGA